MAEESVQVAVRMRCFNQREKTASATRIVRMEKMDKGSRTWISDPENPTAEEKKFEYDFSFQTFSPDEPAAGEWADQEAVFTQLGRPVMESALEGRNICLFAYGQTGAGKSFSMLGKPDQPGIIPRTCNAIFETIAQDTEKVWEYTVDIQVVEVYCEQINDLLADRKTWPVHGHKPRMTNNGYVVDTVRTPCFGYEDIQRSFRFADGNRSVGSHALNPESSRAHTIYTINYERKKRKPDGKVAESVFTRINLVDLAGSERTDSAGTKGQMLVEGNAINLSLTALGSCIKCLSEGAKPNFRDSKLTLLLQGSMTNGRVVMIAAVSPASICRDETMSTLRFADRIKKVKIKVARNVVKDPVADMKKKMEAMREEMQSEIDNLRGRLTGTETDPEDLENLKELLQTQEREREEMRIAYENRLLRLNETTGDRQKRAAEINTMQTRALGGQICLDKSKVTRPYLTNLHEDPRLAESLVYELQDGDTTIGKRYPQKQPDLVFNGMGMIKNHCTINITKGQVFLNANPLSRTMVNGKSVTQPVELKHNYRVWFGNNYAFRFVYPGKEAATDQTEVPDYATAEQEMTEAAESVHMPKVAAADLPETVSKELCDALQKTEKANIIAKDVGANVEYEVRLFQDRTAGNVNMAVRVQFCKGERLWYWGKFQAKLVEFTRAWQDCERCQDRGERYVMPTGLFVDDEPQIIGEADMWLKALANMMEFECDSPVISLTGKVEGNVHVKIEPCDAAGNTGPWDPTDPMDPFVDEPVELLRKEIHFRVTISDLVFDTKEASCKYSNVQIQYKFDVNEKDSQWVESAKSRTNGFQPGVRLQKDHIITVDEKILKHLKTGRMLIQVWADVVDHCDATDVAPEAVEEEDFEVEQRRRTIAELDAEIEEKTRILTALL